MRRALMLVLIAAQAHAQPATRALGKGELPSGVKAPDGFKRAIAWHDKNGENVALFASRENRGDATRSAWLRVDHVVIAGGAARTLRTVKDGVEECDEDVIAAFIDAATGVTDLDGDGVGELTFAYRVSCKSDASSDTIKLLVLQNDDKRILRGESVVEIAPGEKHGGEFKADPPESQWPPALLAHAKKLWKKIR